MEKRSFEWWGGQATSLFLGVAAIGISGNITVGAIVAYLLFVLVDIREYIKTGSRQGE